MTNQPLPLTVTDVAVTRPPRLRKISFQTLPQKITILWGPSGCGKSSLLQTISGVLTPDSGTISFEGITITPCLLWHRRCSLSLQNGNLPRHWKASDVLKLWQTTPSTDSIFRDHISARLGISELLSPRVRELSGGQRQRLAVAAAMLRNAEIYLLDEPTANLNQEYVPIIRTLMETKMNAGATVIVATHDSRLITDADHRIFLEAQ